MYYSLLISQIQNHPCLFIYSKVGVLFFIIYELIKNKTVLIMLQSHENIQTV